MNELRLNDIVYSKTGKKFRVVKIEEGRDGYNAYMISPVPNRYDSKPVRYTHEQLERTGCKPEQNDGPWKGIVFAAAGLKVEGGEQ